MKGKNCVFSKVRLLVLALFGLHLGGLGQTSVLPLDSLFTSLSNFGFFHGTVLVAQDGDTFFSRSSGGDNNDSSRYELASLSKVFTAVAVMQLTEKGKINLESAVQKYLPAFPYPSVKIRHLLSHTSGLPDFPMFDSILNITPGRIMQNHDILPVLKNGVKLLFEPGTQ